MSYAKIINGSIDEVKSKLPNGDRELIGGAWVMPYRAEWSSDQLAACGWFEISQTVKPEGPAVRSIELLEGVPTVVWTERELTAGEVEQAAKREAKREAKQAAKAAGVGLGRIANGTGDLAELAAAVLAITVALEDD